jgi:hypoxanthine phosphoribosyltransferase
MKTLSGRLLFPPHQIQTAVAEIARQVDGWVQSGSFKTLGWITVAEGGRTFSADLSRQVLALLPSLSLIRGEVRVKGTTGTKLLQDREVSLTGWDSDRFQHLPVLLVDDLVDSGRTLLAVKETLGQLGMVEIKTAVALNKHSSLRATADFVALDLGLTPEDLSGKGLQDIWVYGYGMDLNGLHRGDPAIWGMEMKSSG